ncbi:hypothetical protein ACN47E_003954 [Coniothyrium glycines]
MSFGTRAGNTVTFGAIEVDLSQLDLNDHSSRVDWVRISSCVFIVLVLATVGLRVFARAMCVRKIFTDDILIISAAVFTVALASTCLAATNDGLGTHIWLLPMARIFETIKNCVLYLYICQILYAFAISLTKIAVISSYLRFIQEKGFRWSMYTIAMSILALWVTGVFVTVFQCQPVSGAWNFTLADRRCINYVNYLYASSAVNVLTDILLCVLPWPHLWRLNMPLKQRIILCMLLAGGMSACVIGIVRVAYLGTLRSTDITFSAVPCLILSVGECSLGIVSVSIPALRPLVQRLFPSMRSPGSSSQRRSWHVRLGSVARKRDKPTSNATDKQAVSISQENLTQIAD